VEISIEADEHSTELTVLRVGSASGAAKNFNGKAVMVFAHGVKRGKTLWVRSEAMESETNGTDGIEAASTPTELQNQQRGIVAASTYIELQNLQKGEPKTDQFELRKFTWTQRLARYGRLDIVLAFLAVIVAASAAAATFKLFRSHDVTDTIAIVGPLLIAVLGVVSASRQVGSPPW
jgi:hypothetical protein